jgi:GNAT superfamily N-acetyltransferase
VPQIPVGFAITQLRAEEVPVLREWARAEGWNPGHHDIDIAWQLDPGAFLALRLGNELVGGGTIFSHHGDFGFMGLFIVRPDMRGNGLGTALWFHRRDALVARLSTGASIGMDGVFDMVPFYERGGFELAYRDLRFDGIAAGDADPTVVEAATLPFEQLDALDTQYFPTARTSFLRLWLNAEGTNSVAVVEDGTLLGFGATRACESGHRFGPVIALNDDVALRIISTLMHRIEGQPVQIDVPEVNEAGLAIAQQFGMTESFGCARMYLGGIPDLEIGNVYGVTSFEFG